MKKEKQILDTEKIIQLIKEELSCYYLVDKNIFESKSRKSNEIKIKHICIHLSMDYLKSTTTSMGKYFNLKHSMIIYINKKIKGYLEWDETFRKELKEIKSLLDFKIFNEENISKEKYYIPLNDFYSLKLEENKAIILKGFTEDEINSIKLVNKYNNKEYISIFEPRKHINQKFYILEKKDEENNNTSQRI